MALAVPLRGSRRESGVAQFLVVRPHDTHNNMKTHTKILMATVAAALIAVGCATTAPKSPTWEYKTRTSTNRITMSMLGNYGKSGWELVTVDRIPVVRADTNSVTTTNLMYQYLFKRPRH